MLKHPEGVPHAVTDNDIYNGYYIPSGMSWRSRNRSVVTLLNVRSDYHCKYLVRAVDALTTSMVGFLK